MAFNSNLAKQLEAGRQNPGGADQTERVWMEWQPDQLAPTQYHDLQDNPSIDMRTLLAEVEGVARRHWWTKTNKLRGADDYGTTPDGPAISWPEEQANFKQKPPAAYTGKSFAGEPEDK